VVATTNPGKIRELSRALADCGIEVCGLEALALQSDVEEHGATFEANARSKAEAYSRLTDLPVIADDSGLEVDALDGAPGIHSARFGGAVLDDAGRNRLLLSALEGVPEARRTARFVCVLALALAGRTLATFDGRVEGRVASAGSGAGGFGYDPVFFHEPSGCTFGELTPEQKARVSHRGQAIAHLTRALRSEEPHLRAVFDSRDPGC
jgi:XTP/dITP diphosphohydrolase